MNVNETVAKGKDSFYSSRCFIYVFFYNGENLCGRAAAPIILSCGMDYLKGNKSLEEAVALIQNRASLYMSERYG